jgi:hypothetical protein
MKTTEVNEAVVADNNNINNMGVDGVQMPADCNYFPQSKYAKKK